MILFYYQLHSTISIKNINAMKHNVIKIIISNVKWHFSNDETSPSLLIEKDYQFKIVGINFISFCSTFWFHLKYFMWVAYKSIVFCVKRLSLDKYLGHFQSHLINNFHPEENEERENEGDKQNEWLILKFYQEGRKGRSIPYVVWNLAIHHPHKEFLSLNDVDVR